MLILTSPPAFRRPRCERVSSKTGRFATRRSCCRRSTAAGGFVACGGVFSGASRCSCRDCSRLGQGCFGSALESSLPMLFAPLTGSGLLTPSVSLPTLVTGGTTSAGILIVLRSPTPVQVAVSRFKRLLHKESRKESEQPAGNRQTIGQRQTSGQTLALAVGARQPDPVAAVSRQAFPRFPMAVCDSGRLRHMRPAASSRWAAMPRHLCCPCFTVPLAWPLRRRTWIAMSSGNNRFLALAVAMAGLLAPGYLADTGFREPGARLQHG